MSIKYVQGDATLPGGNDKKIILHCCNDIGAWGSGFVVALSQRFGNYEVPGSPESEYRQWYEDDTTRNFEKDIPFTIGQVQFVPVGTDMLVANMIGQSGVNGKTVRDRVDYTAVGMALERVREMSKRLSASVHCPRFCAGLAGGDWNRIEKLLIQELIQHGVKVTVYDYVPPTQP